MKMHHNKISNDDYYYICQLEINKMESDFFFVGLFYEIHCCYNLLLLILCWVLKSYVWFRLYIRMYYVYICLSELIFFEFPTEIQSMNSNSIAIGKWEAEKINKEVHTIEFNSRKQCNVILLRLFHVLCHSAIARWQLRYVEYICTHVC